MLCDRQINLGFAADAALRPFMAGTFRVKLFVKSHDLANKYTLASGFSRLTQFLLACMRVRYGWATSFLRQSREMDNPI